MGRIFEQFHSLKNKNEADVNQNFVIPLLTKYLGFSLEDIKPERDFPAKDIFYGRKKISSKELPVSQRPDFVICINDILNPKYVVDGKAPNEPLTKHLPQLISYAIGVGVNFLVITNGRSLRIYDVNLLIFEAKDIAALDLKFNIVKKILCKEVQSSYSPIEIIQGVDIDKALDKSLEQIKEQEKIKRQLKISDFQEYLRYVKREFQNWQIPREFQSSFYSEIQQYPPDKLHRFQIYEISRFGVRDEKKYILTEIEQKFNTPIKVFIGSSGVGKTTLLKYITYMKAGACLSLHNPEIPVYIQLRNFGPNVGLKNLIVNALEKGATDVSLERLPEFLQKHTFLFLLDAFDEVQEKYLEDVKREIDEFVGVGKHKIIITSRETRPINPRLSSRFFVNPLQQSEIENLLEQYFGSERFRFMFEIESKGLVEESRNILLLTLMVLIYKGDHALPLSRTKIIGSVIEKIKKWEKSKGERLTDGLGWEVKEKIFSELAYRIVETQENLALSRKQVDGVLMPLLNYFEKHREIPRGMDKHRVMNDLALTGFVSYNADMLFFWHRAFLDYFASKALAEKYLETPKILEDIKSKFVWEPIIAASVEHLDDSTKFVESIKSSNLFLASACILEAKKISTYAIKDTVSRLATKCSSPIKKIRSRAVWFLERIKPKHTIDIFFDLLKNNKYPDVRKTALEEVAKEKSERAKRTVHKLIDWDEGGISLGSTQGSVAKALSNFNADDQLKTIEIWRRKPDFFTNEDCMEAMRNVVREERLTERVKKALLDFYLEKGGDKDLQDHKKAGLADVLIDIGDEKLVPRLIESFELRNSQDSYLNIRTEDILANYRSKQVIERLSSGATDRKNSDLMREGCSGALCKSKGTVSLSIFEKLLEDKNPKVRQNAVKGLDRFSSSEVKDLLLQYVNDENAGVQYQVIEVLGDKGLLVELVKKNVFPKKFYRFSTQILLEQIRRYRLQQMLPILNWLEDKVCDDDRRLIDVAHTYCVLGKEEKAKAIIESFFHETGLVVSKYGLADLAEISPAFGPSYALRIIREVLRSIKKLGEKSGFWEDKCIDSLERIGGQEVLDILKDLAERHAVQKDNICTERALRAINHLATDRDEEWYINFIKSNPNLERFALNRAIEGLGVVGSEKSIPTVKEIAILHKGKERTIDSCFLSLENIYRTRGIPTQTAEKDLFK